MDRGVEFAQLVFALTIARNVSGESPIAQFIGRFS